MYMKFLNQNIFTTLNAILNFMDIRSPSVVLFESVLKKKMRPSFLGLRIDNKLATQTLSVNSRISTVIN